MYNTSTPHYTHLQRMQLHRFMLGTYELLNCANTLHEERSGYDEPASPTLLYIDDMYNIVLPTQGNAVIKMEPLPKSLYILLLRHPEGIILKNISNYRHELEFIYRRVSTRNNNTVIKRLMTQITIPHNNMLHKNISIIRTAFTTTLGSEAARNYIPTYCHGKEEYIKLERAYIRFPRVLQ